MRCLLLRRLSSNVLSSVNVLLSSQFGFTYIGLAAMSSEGLVLEKRSAFKN